MHRVIIIERMGLPRPSVHHTVDHDDGKSLNNQRENLFWRTGAEQMFTRARLAQPAPVSAESLDAIPF